MSVYVFSSSLIYSVWNGSSDQTCMRSNTNDDGWRISAEVLNVKAYPGRIGLVCISVLHINKKIQLFYIYEHSWKSVCPRRLEKRSHNFQKHMESSLSAHHRFIRMRSKPITFYYTQYFRQHLKPRRKYCEIVKTAKINTKESEGKFSRRPLLLATPVIKYQENFQFNLFLANSVAGALQWLLKHFQEVIWFFSPSRSVHFSLSCSFSLSLCKIKYQHSSELQESEGIALVSALIAVRRLFLSSKTPNGTEALDKVELLIRQGRHFSITSSQNMLWAQLAGNESGDVGGNSSLSKLLWI